jgi:hypothetical protein
MAMADSRSLIDLISFRAISTPSKVVERVIFERKF